ncbi:Neuroguidin [Halotydeus destructor]|nr:Neuroguidin [Halotydeus destructor]
MEELTGLTLTDDAFDISAATKELLGEIDSNSKTFSGLVKRLEHQIQSGHLPTSSGLGFLEVKNLTLLSYLIDLTYIALRKCKGQSIEDNPAIDRLVENRTVIEKMKPIHFKLKYRIDKLIRAADNGNFDLSDPLQLKPRPNELVLDDEGNSSDEDSAEESNKVKEKKSNVYVPPKVSAMHYDDEDVETRQDKALKKAKRRALSSSVMEELRQEFDDAPEEIAENTVGRKRQNKIVKDREAYEEEYMVRLNIPKKQLARENKESFVTMSSLSRDIAHFEDISVLDRNNSDGFSNKRKKASTGPKKKTKGYGKKKKFKKFSK